MQKMLELLGLGSQVLFALDLEQTYWRTFLANAALFPGAKDFLDDLRLNSIPMAIVTDLTAQIQFRKMIYFGLDHYFDCIVSSEEAGQEKPHPAPFQLALKKVQPKGSTIWMIGDNPKKDIGGAKAAVQAVTFQKMHHGVELGMGDNSPDCYFEDFSELRSLLQTI
jgi:putative hydrolase of the HAD superfamily